MAPSVWKADPDPSPPEAGDYIVFRPTGEIIAKPHHSRLTFPGRTERAKDDQNTSSGIAMTASAPASTLRRCAEDSLSSRSA